MPAKICTVPFGVTLADAPPSGLLSARDCNGRDVRHGLLNGYTLDLHWEDVPEKRDRMQDMLDSTDYIIIATNRRYDSQSRIPARWPMTNRYYDALFSGELGFDLVKTFQEAFELGPIKISDQYLPTYSAPKWLNEFEAEEAFHVYDHPVVFIFQKNQSYSPENTMAILGDAELNSVGSVFGGYNDPTITGVINNLWSLDADPAPTQLEFTKDMQSIQDAGGTWSDRFSRESIINTNQVVATLVWWAAIVVFGWITYPILFIAFPTLGDRGYAFAKFTGMLIVGWGTWALSSLRIAVWSQGGILGGFTLLAALNVWIVWRNREKFSTFLRTRWRLLAWIEGVTFILFIVFVAIRLSNPDLWHSSFGGEKPMDFAYFNATLRSTIFPPIDPWFADGFLNYYYFGYVIVGVPTLLLGVVPSLAYNLIIPTLFSITGISAFSVTYSIVNGWRSKLDVARLPDAASLESSPPSPKRRSLGNPWVAGVMALLLAVVLGNLDTVRVFGLGVANVGGYKQPISLQSYLVDEYVQDFGVPPDETATLEIAERASEDHFGDRLQYEWHNVSSLIGGIFRGFGEMLSGADLHISSERWFWAPTRIIAEIPNSGDGAINEMPFFTFLYGDLHAHMIAMPMMLFAMAFVYNELMISGRDRRRKFAQFVAIALGALTVGMFQATNTWDVPTFMLLSVLGLAYAWWLRWKKFTRWSIWDGFVRVGGFIALALAVALPFSFWFASGLTSFKVWQGNKTPFWAYFQIHGLFLFLLISLLLWETARWLRAVRVAQIRGKLPLLSAILFATGMILLGSLILAAIEYQVALIVIPLVWWIALLFLRPGQSRPMQYILVLAGLALAITLGTEVVTLANDNGRQNTIFKFYIQAWLLLSVACGAGFSWMVGGSGKWSGRLAVVWYSVAGLLIFIAALYPIMATRGKSQFRMAPDTPMTLDGMEYMRNASHFEDGVSDIFELKYDYQAIRWLQDNVQGSPVIMEAQSKGSLYKWGGRISINTGLPSVIGWDYHQRQQRSVNPLPSMVNQRAANVNAFYTTEDITAAAEILRVYDVKYVILTAYEQARYGNSGGLDKFDEMVERGMLSVAYHEDLSTIYEVNPDMLEAIHVASLINRAEQDNQS
jgi:YYY domain-containing protein